MRRPIHWILIGIISVVLAGCGSGQNASSSESFRFIAFGDSRVPAYLPYTDLIQIDAFVDALLADLYGSHPPPFARSIDPYTGQVATVKIGLPDQYQLSYYKDGWPDMIYKSSKSGGGYGSIQMRRAGQRWVYDNVVNAVQNGADFVLHNGDITYWGYTGAGIDVNPYWQDFIRHFLSRLPADNPDGLPGRFFASVGNHETWHDSDILGFRETFPYLAELGFSKDNRTYSFDYKNSRFIFLYSGTFPDTGQGTKTITWTGDKPGFAAQMTWLESKLLEARAKGLKHVFVTYHFPSFTLAEEEPPLPLDASNNPHLTLQNYAQDLDIVVFNGHVHTTEMFSKDGVRYLNVGGGGGEQEYGVSDSRPTVPPELYWNGAPRVEEYNYIELQVNGNRVRFFVYRWRPEGTTPYETVEVFQ